MMTDNLNDKLFYQRLDELADRSKARFCPQFTHFLDSRNLRCAMEHITYHHPDVLGVSFGGFEDAERRIVGLFPRDIYDVEGYDVKDLHSHFDIKALVVKGSSFSTFSHRDVMGAVLSLGVKREAVGDIYVPQSGDIAYICLTDVAAQYVSDNLESVSRDRVKTEICDVMSLPAVERKFSVISGTVASERLDCVLSLALKVSRDKSKQLINAGLVSLNHMPETRYDCKVLDGDLISARGYGRFKVAELGDLTRKGRNRAVIHKYV